MQEARAGEIIPRCRFGLVDFLVLGPLEVLAEEGSVIRIGGNRQRTVLGALLTRAGEAVSVDRLIDVVWGDDIPNDPKSALQVAVSRLRKLMGNDLCLPVTFLSPEQFEVKTSVPIAERGTLLEGRIEFNGDSRPLTARALSLQKDDKDIIKSQQFGLFQNHGDAGQTVIRQRMPTVGCVKFNISMGLSKPVWPYHSRPSVLDVSGRRVSISYEDAISRLAQYMLDHRGRHDRTCVYACGQVDYFGIFAFQEVFRLLGLRNIGGNAEHCLNAGALHNEMLTGQEGPFLTLEQAVGGDNRFFLFNGWNGLITHPPAWTLLAKRKHLDAYIVEVAISETAQALAERLGNDRVMLIRPSSDPHFALAVANAILHRHAGAIETRFLKQYSDIKTFHKYARVAQSEDFSPKRVAERIVPEKHLAKRILKGILDIAAKIADPDIIPINIPSVGLSQTSSHWIAATFMP